MAYEIFDNKIIVDNCDLDVFATLYSGQVFRFEQVGENIILLTSGDKVALIRILFEKTEILTDDVPYFINFFDLERNYLEILDVDDDFALSKIQGCPSLKVLKQPHFETVISFIMSANNNITRFSKTLKKIAEKYGQKREFMGYTYHTFPTPKDLASADLTDLKALGCGYRDRYVVETSKMIPDGFSLEETENLPTDIANKRLCQLVGVGEKVADCILLFSYQKYDVFPVDTWIEKVYKENYGGKLTDRKKIRRFFVDKFGKYAGIIQQYIFYFAMNKK
ncbi:MAG: hypothetical protein IJ938_03440 [Clostridia bacterium]|nr:hypothetical protein [Clostridia bacterium]